MKKDFMAKATLGRIGACSLALALALGGTSLAACGSNASGSTDTQSGEAQQADASTTEHETWVATSSTVKTTNTPSDASAEPTEYQVTTKTEHDEQGNPAKVNSESTNTFTLPNQDAPATSTTKTESTSTFDENGYITSTTNNLTFTTPALNIDGVESPSSEDTDTNTNTYKNEYDDQGRIVKQTTIYDEKLVTNMSDYVSTYEYNDAGYISCVTNSYTNKTSSDSPEQAYVIVNNYDEKGLLQSASTTITNKIDGSEISKNTVTYKYEFDDEGRPISATATSKEDSSYSYEWKGTYDQTGNLVKESSTTKSDVTGTMTIEATAEWKKVDNPSMATKQTYHIQRYR